MYMEWYLAKLLNLAKKSKVKGEPIEFSWRKKKN